MSKKATLTDVSSGYSSGATLNANFKALNDQFENTLSLDGSTPNKMGGDLDLDSNDLLNAGEVSAQTLRLGGEKVVNLSSTPSWKGTWVTAQNFVVNDLVQESGSTYICLVSHTSGTFSTDLSNNLWELFASKGSAGAGTGGMLATNNLSDVSDVAASRANLGLGTAATTASTAYATATQGTKADNAIPAPATPASGDVLYHNGSAWVRLPKGTDGEKLTLASGVPAWGGSGGVSALATVTALASASIDFTHFDSTKYEGYFFEVASLIPDTNGVDLYVRFSSDGGSTYDDGATDYRYVGSGLYENGAGLSIYSSGGQPYISLAVAPANPIGNTGSKDGWGGTVRLHGPHRSGKTRLTYSGNYQIVSSDFLASITGTGLREAAGDTNAIRFLFSSGLIRSGTITMYGIEKL